MLKKISKINNSELINQKTLAIVKPNVIKENLIGEVISFFEKKKLRVIGLKMVKFSSQKAKNFYNEHSTKPFFPEMVKFICNSPVVVLCLEGKNAIKLSREIIGATNPSEAKEGTIRKAYGKDITANAIHGSDSLESAEREINLLFAKKEIFIR